MRADLTPFTSLQGERSALYEEVCNLESPIIQPVTTKSGTSNQMGDLQAAGTSLADVE